MIYPTESKTFYSHLQLNVPRFDLVKPIYEKQFLINPLYPPPHWTKIWASSIALSQYLMTHPTVVNNKTILEVGAGIGLPSFSIAHLAKNIILTDYAIDAIELMQENIKQLELENTTAQLLDWHTLDHNIECDVLLLSDINYDPTQFEALATFINSYLDRSSTVIIATPNRIISSPFIQKFATFIKELHKEYIVENNNEVEIGIFTLRH